MTRGFTLPLLRFDTKAEQDFLYSKGLQYYTYGDQSTETKGVIRGLPTNMDIHFIYEDFVRQGIGQPAVYPMTTRRVPKKVLLTYLIETTTTRESLFSVTDLYDKFNSWMIPF